MPHFVMNRVRVEGPAERVAAFAARAISTREDDGTPCPRRLDFNAFVPMPEIIRRTEASSQAWHGWPIVAYEMGGDAEPLLDHLKDPGFRQKIADRGLREDADGVLAVLRATTDPSYLAEACVKAAVNLRAFRETGHRDWYGWCNANWGTKWNALSLDVVEEAPGRLHFTFETAWSAPQPIFERMAAEFPEITFLLVGFEDMWGFAYRGEYKAGSGTLTISKATAALYEEAHGRPPPPGTEEEDDADSGRGPDGP